MAQETPPWNKLDFWAVTTTHFTPEVIEDDDPRLQQFREELAQRKPGVQIALDLYQRFLDAGLRNIYLVPPIRRGGARNYNAAREFLSGAGVH